MKILKKSVIIETKYCCKKAENTYLEYQTKNRQIRKITYSKEKETVKWKNYY